MAVVSNPDLKAARAKARVADAQVFNAGLLPDPQVNFTRNQRLSGPDPFNGYAFAVVYELNALRERHVLLEGQRAAARQTRLDLEWQELQTAGQAELLAARVAGLTRALDFARATRTSTDAGLRVALIAQARGDIRGDEVETRRLAAADAASNERAAEIALNTAWADLDKLLGLPPETRLPIGLPSTAEPPASAESLFVRARTERLDLAALRAGYNSQNAQVRKAIMDAFPSLQITLGRGRDTANNITFDTGVNFTLPVFNQNRGGVAVAKATRDQLRAEYGARLFTARADIAELVSQLTLEARQRAEIAAQVEPTTRIVQASETAAARGDISRSAAQSARQSLADKQLALSNLDQAMAEQRVTLALAVGGPLTD